MQYLAVACAEELILPYLGLFRSPTHVDPTCLAVPAVLKPPSQVLVHRSPAITDEAIGLVICVEELDHGCEC